MAGCAGPGCQAEVVAPVLYCSPGCRVRRHRHAQTFGVAHDVAQLLRGADESTVVAALLLVGPQRLDAVRQALSGAVVSEIGNGADVRR